MGPSGFSRGSRHAAMGYRAYPIIRPSSAVQRREHREPDSHHTSAGRLCTPANPRDIAVALRLLGRTVNRSRAPCAASASQALEVGALKNGARGWIVRVALTEGHEIQ